MTAKEALEAIRKEHLEEELTHSYDVKYMNEVVKGVTSELEALKKDYEKLKNAVRIVNRHGIIQFSNGNFDTDWKNFIEAKQTLSKVGKEE